jgi:hypothetical protein
MNLAEVMFLSFSVLCMTFLVYKLGQTFLG